MKKINFLWVALATAAGIAACGDSSTVEVTDAGVADSGVKDSGSQTDTGVIDAGTVDATPAPTCTDRIKNGTEADIDCGGSCAAKCGDGKACAAAGDCTSGACSANVCASPACIDSAKNGSETAVDCGGACPPSVMDSMTAISDWTPWTLPGMKP